MFNVMFSQKFFRDGKWLSFDEIRNGKTFSEMKKEEEEKEEEEVVLEEKPKQKIGTKNNKK